MPPITTCAPPSVMGNGSDAACAVELARFVPKIEIRPPGATGVPGEKLAELRMPPAFRMGGSALAAISPVTCAVPEIAGGDTWAVMVMLAVAAAARGSHVPDQVPLPSDASPSGGSPFEKVATTVPPPTLLPQSSTTCACMATGQPAGTLNPGR